MTGDEREGRDAALGEALVRLEVPAHRARFWADLDARLAAEAGAERDEELGEALAGLPVPPHAAGFWDALAARVADEAVAPRPRQGAPEPTPPPSPVTGEGLWLAPRPDLRPAPTGGAARGPTTGPSPTGPSPSRPSPADELWARRERRRRPARAAAAAAALSVAAAVAFVATGLVAGDPARTTDPSVVAAPGTAEASRPMVAPAATVEAVTGEVVERIGSEEQVWSITLSGDGSRREELRGGQVLRTYDADTGTLVYVNRGLGTPVDAGRNAGYPPAGGPDDSIGSFLPFDLAAHVAGRAHAGDPTVEETDFLGRPAWHATVEHPALSGTDVVWRADVTVDQATSLPLTVVEDRDGTRVEVTFTSFEAAAEPPDPGTFTLELPADADPATFDAGFTRIDPATPGLLRAAPDALPEGFALDQVVRLAPRDITVVTYRRGFEHLVVRVAPHDGDVRNPFSANHPVGPAEAVELDGGSFAGAAELVTTPPTVPHVWAADDTHVVTVSGPLAGDVLVTVASSLDHA